MPYYYKSQAHDVAIGPVAEVPRRRAQRSAPSPSKRSRQKPNHAHTGAARRRCHQGSLDGECLLRRGQRGDVRVRAVSRGLGFMRESTSETMALDARVRAIGDGVTEVMLEEVAKRI